MLPERELPASPDGTVFGQEEPMTRSTSRHSRGRTALSALAALAVALSCLGISSRLAVADNVYITNCVNQVELLVCSYNSSSAAKDGGLGYNDKLVLDTNDQKEFSCGGDCHFYITDCNDSDDDCKTCAYGYPLDDEWGSGYYLFKSLKLNGDQTGWSSSDMTKASEGTTCS